MHKRLSVYVLLTISVVLVAGRKRKRKHRKPTPPPQQCEHCVPSTECACAGAIGPSASADMRSGFLSDPSDFPERERTKRTTGLHIGCACACAEDPAFVFFTFAKDASSASPMVNFTVNADATFAQFRMAAEEALRIPQNPGNYKMAEKFRQPWRVFDPSTRLSVHSIEGMLRSVGPRFEDGTHPPAGMVFLVEGGQFVFQGLRKGSVQIVQHTSISDETRTSVLKTLSLRPLVFSVESYLSETECDHLIGLVADSMDDLRESPVVKKDFDVGKETKQWRTSKQMWLRKTRSDITRDLASRASDLTGTGYKQQADYQILRYLRTQFYSKHHDAFDPNHYQGHVDMIEHGHKNRLLTLFWYLSDVDAGGETHFPMAFGNPKPHDMWDCSETSTGLKVSPRKGNIILWYNLHPNGVLDEHSLHGGCPVEGEATKWSANSWIWNKDRN